MAKIYFLLLLSLVVCGCKDHDDRTDHSSASVTSSSTLLTQASDAYDSYADDETFTCEPMGYNPHGIIITISDVRLGEDHQTPVATYVVTVPGTIDRNGTGSVTEDVTRGYVFNTGPLGSDYAVIYSDDESNNLNDYTLSIGGHNTRCHKS